jgi:biopolymer transport protein ExbB
MEFVSDVVEKGGLLVYPLLFIFVWSLYIIVIKAASLRRARIIKHDAIEEIEKLLIKRRIPEATAYCKQHSVPMTRVLLAAILNYEKDESELKDVLEEAGRQEIPIIRRHLTALGTIASVAPLLGLLGTVLGMISVFTTLSQDTAVNAGMLAGGISEALVTTALGMLVAVPALTSYNYFISRVQNLIIEMERVSLHMVAVLKRGTS